MTGRKKKLIEVALPLDEINAASKADKERKTGTVRNIHKWFAPMPLPAWRALLFAALIDDPEDDNHRVYLLDLIKRLVQNGADLPDPSDVAEANTLLVKQFPDGLPTVMDPFCGGGSTLIEAQRLGLPTFGSDLNPVPALISRTLTEVLPPVYGDQPVRPASFREGELAIGRVYRGYEGLAEDVRYYGEVVRERVSSAISDAYPANAGEVPVAWLWGRTAKCVNPACGVETVLVTSLWVSKKPGDFAWMEPEVFDGQVRMRVVSGQRTGAPQDAPKVGRGTSFACLACSSVLGDAALVEAGARGEIGYRLLAVTSVVAGRRVYRTATPAEEAVALGVAVPEDIVDIPQSTDTRSFSGPRFGFPNFADLFMPRQLLALTAFADRVAELHSELLESGIAEDRAKAIVSLLGLGVGKLAHGSSTQSRWKFDSRSGTAKAISAFARNDLRLAWDFAEVNPLSDGAMSWIQSLETLIDALPYVPHGTGKIRKADARVTVPDSLALIATDPPYFDAIDYADLSDYFYMWHRRALRFVHPDLYTTVATPKASELISSPGRHGNDKDAARAYFIDGFTETFRNLARSSVPDLPMLVVYASKEQRAGEEETRWSAILTAMVNAELEVTGTWPIHGTGSSRMIGIGANAVASYIVMSCRPRATSAITTSLSDFTRALRRELGPAVRDLQAASILPVDLAQAAMGPGMQIYSRYRAVLDQSGQRVPVEHALRLINVAREAVLDEQEGELDPESRFAVRWWEAHGWNPSVFDDAAKTARPLGISVDDVARAHVVTSKGNKVQLLGSADLDPRWVPSADIRPTAWEAVHHLAHRLIDRGGELEAARLMAVLGNLQDPSMALVYRLHDIAAKKGRTVDQERYNALINSWAELMKLSADNSTTIEELF